MHASRLSRRLAAVAIAALTALLVAACGGGTKPPAAGVAGRSAQHDGAQAAYRFSACMRAHGVSNFQDPRITHDANHVTVGIHIDPAITSSPNFKSAQSACSHLLPNGGNGPTPAQVHARAAAILAFARCMRRHGFPRFPDPTSQGQLTPTMLSRAGIDLQQPAIRPAAYACLPLTHGIITRADVNQAISHPNGGGSQSSSAGG